MTRDTLRLLRQATVRNPLLSDGTPSSAGAPAHAPIGSQATCSGRELLAMVREALRDLRDSFAEASKRHAMEPVALPQTLAAGRQQKVLGALALQSARIRKVEAYLSEQEQAFSALLDAPPTELAPPADLAPPTSPARSPTTLAARRSGATRTPPRP